MRWSLLILVLCCFLSPFALSQANPHSVPTVDAELGPCSANLTVTDTDNKPVYAAKVTVRVQYGRFHRLDLEVSTNIDGKGRFAGLPTNPRRGLFFEASEGDRTGNAFNDPSAKCNADLAITLRKSSQPAP